MRHAAIPASATTAIAEGSGKTRGRRDCIDESRRGGKYRAVEQCSGHRPEWRIERQGHGDEREKKNHNQQRLRMVHESHGADHCEQTGYRGMPAPFHVLIGMPPIHEHRDECGGVGNCPDDSH